MAKKKLVKNSKILAVVLIVVTIVGLLVQKIYADQDVLDRYTLTVVTDSATNADSVLRISEKSELVDAENLNYDVTLENVNGLKEMSNQYASYENDIAFLIDTSYSMNTNDPDHKSKTMASELATKILSEVNNSYITVSTNNSVKLGYNTTNSSNATTVTNTINNLTYGEVLKGDTGLQNAYSTISSKRTANYTNKVNKYIVVFTDSTDWVADKMKEITTGENADEDLRIITVLFNFTSSSYINSNNTPVSGDVYYVDTDEDTSTTTQVVDGNTDPNSISNTQVSLPAGTEDYNKNIDKIIDGMNNVAKDITITSKFPEAIVKNFTITYTGVDTSKISKASNKNAIKGLDDLSQKDINGYTWNISKLASGDSLTLKYKLTLKKDKEISADYLLKDIITNDEQKITYKSINLENGQGENAYKENQELKGLDKNLENTTENKHTVIRIAYGYELNLVAVNETNDNVKIPNLRLHIVGKQVTGEDQYGNRTYGKTVCDLQDTKDQRTGKYSTKYTTDTEGKLILGIANSSAFRDAGTIEYTITPIVDSDTNVGYVSTDPIIFDVNNNDNSKTLQTNNHNASEKIFKVSADEQKRTVNVQFSIKCKTSDFEIKTVEQNKDTVVIPGIQYELTEPKQNVSNERRVITGTSDENGILHLNPTVMTEDGTYTYILRQLTTSSTYSAAPISTFTVTYKDAKIVSVGTAQMGDNHVKTELSTKANDDNHVLITVGNDNQEQNPFDFQLKLSDETDGTPIDGVTYAIQTIDSNNVAGPIKYYTTGNGSDDQTGISGQINAKLYGTGLVQVKVTEQSPKVGYQTDAQVKSTTINIINGQITIIDQNGTSGYDYIEGSNKTGLKLELTSKKKTEQNVVDVRLLDNTEHDIGIGSNVVYRLKDTETGEYTERATSDRNGHIKFTIGSKTEGNHIFALVADKDTIPEEYDETKVPEEARFNIEFDNRGYISGASDLDSTVNVQTSTVTGDSTTEHTAFAEVYFELLDSKIAEFRVQLADKDNNTAINGAQYNINIEWDETATNGEIVHRNKTITGRKTNSSGIITTHIKKASQVNITVEEVSAATGYVCDTTTQEIVLQYLNNGTVIIASQTPYDKGVNNQKSPNYGASVDNGIVVYRHYNKKRTAADTYLNLTLTYEDFNSITNGAVTGSPVDGIRIGFQAHSENGSEELVDGDGNPITFENSYIITGSQQPAQSQGQVVIDYADKTITPNYSIKVPGIGDTATEDAEYVYYLDTAEMKADPNEQGKFIPNLKTKITWRFTFKKRDGRIKLTSAESTFGNRLIEPNTLKYTSSGNESEIAEEDKYGVYMGNVSCKIYTNYDEVGNLSLDLKKQDKEGNPLNGSEYSIRVQNPDGSKAYYGVGKDNAIKVTNGSDSGDIELKGITVAEGSYIYINETKAPVGYDINHNTETLFVEKIEEDGTITLKQVDNAYTPSRLKLTRLASTQVTSNSVKTNYQVDLTDYQLDTFKFGINAVDSQDQAQGVDGYNFKVTTSMGAYGNVITGSDGKGMQKIGGNGTSSTITYTVSTGKAANYYRPMASDIKVNVVFDDAGKVNIAATYDAQTDANYGNLWSFTDPMDTEGQITIQMKVDHQDPLNVKVKTIDKVTNATVANEEYAITPTIKLTGKGSDNISVGYVLEEGPMTYTLKQSKSNGSYASIKNKTFTLRYEKAKVTEVTNTDIKNDVGNIAITGAKEITITLYVELKVPFEITNLYYFDQNQKLQGSNFRVECLKDPNTAIMDVDKVGTGSTDSNGIAGVYSGILGTSEDIIYKVSQTLGATGYATIDDFYVKVTYNENREITAAKLVNKTGEEVTNNRFVTNVSFIQDATKYNKNTKGIVTITVLNYPEFKINITDFDRRDNTTPISGTKYSVTSEYSDSANNNVSFMSASGIETDRNGLGIAHLNKTKDDTIVTYTIKEDVPAIGYQTLGLDKDQLNENKIKIKVSFDANGYVSNVEFMNSDKFSNIVSAKKVDTITDAKDRFIVNVRLQNNPILKVNISVRDTADHTKALGSEIGFTIVGKESDTTYTNSSKTNKVNTTGSPETLETNSNGETAGYLDRTLDSKQMTYEIIETHKPAGYENPVNGHSLVVNVNYDTNGKISTATVNQSSDYLEVTSFDVNNFVINLNIYNEEVKEFNISLTAEDVYDSNKKIDGVEVNAYLVGDGDTGSYTTIDPNCSLVDTNTDENRKQLITGADRNKDGVPDIAHGQDNETMGKYVSRGAGTRILRLIIRNDAKDEKDSGNSGYYLTSADGTKSGKNIGYYRGAQYYADAYFQRVEYQYLISVTFDENGKITDARLITGLNPNIGWLVDNRYVKTEDEKGTIKHTSYNLDIVMKFYPMLNLKINAMDNYTYNDEITKDGKPIALNGSKYTVTTLRNNPTAPDKDEFVTAGYIGYGNYYGYDGAKVQGNSYTATDELFVPIENNYTRLFYVFEENEPTDYQKYRDKRIIYTNQKLVAIIQATFDEKGEINYEKSIVRKITDQDGEEKVIQPYIAEDNSTELSGNNIKAYNYWYNKTDANRNINFYIGYGLTTTIYIRTIDSISENPISNIRITPFINRTYSTQEDYTLWQDTGYRDTNSNGQTYEKYWGAAEANGLNSYIIGSDRISGNYNGYLFPSDMAQTSMGGSGNPADYYAKIDVTYGSDGKISGAKSIGADLWGDNNVKENADTSIKIDKTKGRIYIDMLYWRKFQMTLNKADYYDHTQNKLTAKFDVTSNKGLNTQIASMKMTPMGKVYKSTTVKYTLSETMTPDNYSTIPHTIDFSVTFDKNGNVDDIKSSNDQKAGKDERYFEVISKSESTDAINKTKPDLTINIYNKPAFYINAQVIDRYYKDYGLSGAYLQVTNSKGEQVEGNPQTDNNGFVKMRVSPVHPGETVTYYIKQTNTVNGYYTNSTTIPLEVKFNDKGTIDSYKIKTTDGQQVVDAFNESAYINTKSISMRIMNTPKDIKMGIYKYDKTTNKPMAGVKFTITKVNTKTNESTTKELITEEDGNVIAAIDTFTTGAKTIKYTIHEEETPASYRTMEDVVFTVNYAEDGSIFLINNENSKITVEAATNGKIKYLDGERVHLKATISNDNAYDLVIKDEDSAPLATGIPGTQYDVKINNNTFTTTTGENGEATIANQTESGAITLSIAEHSAGEGYRDNINNKVTIQLEKGTAVYSLKLYNTTDGYIDDNNAKTNEAVISVDEEHGIITVTFKNDTKAELTVLKQDIDTKASLKNAEFNITAQQVNDTGTNIGDEITLTTDTTKVTDENGKIYFDLGKAPISQIWKYTFTEITPPDKTDGSGDKYNAIVPVTMTVTFDQYGRVSKQISNKQSRLNVMLEDDNENCRSMYAIINNGDISPAYKIKVVTEDEDTERRINGSDIYLHVTNADTGETLKIDKKTDGAIPNGTHKETGNLGTDGKIYTDEELENSNKEGGESVPPIIEKGLVYTDPIDFEGTIDIEVSQQGVASGYEAIAKQSSVGNNHIKVKVAYVAHLDDDPTVTFDVLDNAGFAIEKDETNKIIKVVIKNKTKITFNITTQVYGTDPLEPVVGVQYDITAKIVNSVDYTDTDVNVTTPASDANGETEQSVGKAFAGKTVIYTLHQHNAPSDYKVVDDIQIELMYDSRGNIKWPEMLSSESVAYIDEDKTNGKELYINVLNKKHIPDGFYVTLEKRALDTEEDNDAYNNKLEGAVYKITVTQEDVDVDHKVIEWTGTTNEDGWILHNELFKGTGDLTIEIEELQAPDGYKASTKKTITGHRDPDTGKIEFDTSDVGIDIINSKKEAEDRKNQTDKIYRPKQYDDDNPEVYVIPTNPQLDGKFSLAINKVAAGTKEFITEDQAKFNAVLEQTDENGNVTFSYPIDDFYTDETGRARVSNQDLPTAAGDYKLIVNELEAPEGYTKLKTPAIFDVTLITDAKGDITIGSVKPEETTAVYGSVTKYTRQLISVTIENEIEIKADEYSLDITKVARKTGEPIEDMAIFKVQLPDEDKTSVYTETQETQLGKGKLDYCWIEQDKDYTVRLTHMKIPKEECTLTYIFREVTPPQGYRKIDEDLQLDITFVKESTLKKMKEEQNGNSVTNDTVNESENDIANNTTSGDTSDEEDKMVISEIKSSNENFMKWYYNGIDNESFDITKPIKIDILDDIDKDEYTIHYDGNVGNGTLTSPVPADQIKTEDTDLTLSTDVPERAVDNPNDPMNKTEYIFKGWSLSPSATKVDYKPGDTYTLNQAATLYAVWEEKLYLRSTKYLIDDGTNSSANANFWKEGQLSEYEDGDLYVKNIEPQWGTHLYLTGPKYNLGTTIDNFLDPRVLITNADTKELYIPTKDNNGNIVLDPSKKIINGTWDAPLGDRSRYEQAKHYVATGMILKLTKGDQTIQLTLIVKGDLYTLRKADGSWGGSIVGNGIVEVGDRTKLRDLLRRTEKDTNVFTLEEQQALDFFIDRAQRWSYNKSSIIWSYTNCIKFVSP